MIVRVFAISRHPFPAFRPLPPPRGAQTAHTLLTGFTHDLSTPPQKPRDPGLRTLSRWGRPFEAPAGQHNRHEKVALLLVQRPSVRVGTVGLDPLGSLHVGPLDGECPVSEALTLEQIEGFLTAPVSHEARLGHHHERAQHIVEPDWIVNLVDGAAPLWHDQAAVPLAPEQPAGQQELCRSPRGASRSFVPCGASPVSQTPQRQQRLLNRGRSRGGSLVAVLPAV